MPKPTFTIDGTDYTDCVIAGGLKWARNDIDQDGAGRTLDGVMHRSRIATKRQLDINCRQLTEERARQLSNALDKETVSIMYPDMQEGRITRTFYGTKLEGGLWGVRNGSIVWDGVKFTLTEV